MDDIAIMLLPGAVVLDERDAILTSMSGQPWASYELSNWRVLRPAEGTAVVTYRALAHRTGSAPYSPMCYAL